MTRNLTRGALVVATGLCFALALSATPVLADLGAVSPNSWGRVLRYAGCALGIAAAGSGLGLAAVVMMCLHILVTEA